MGSVEDDRIQDALAEYKARVARAGGVGRAKKLSAERPQGNRYKSIQGRGQGSHCEGPKETEEAMIALRLTGLVIVVILSVEWLRSKRKGP